MSYTIANLITDVLPRISIAKQAAGISIYGAANAIKSLIYKHLIYHNSDLIASGDLSVSVPANGYYGTLPADFVSMHERPTAEDVVTNWMAGTVTSYNNTTGALVVNITTKNGSDTLESWNVVTGALPSSSPTIIGTSVTSLTVGTGAQSLTTQAGLSASLAAGTYIIISSTANITELAGYEKRRIDPMTEDDHDEAWWRWYAEHGEEYDPVTLRPSHYKIVGMTIYVRPRPAISILISGRYNAKPTDFTTTADVIPWNSLFDEVFREGVVKLILSGTQIPEENQAIMVYVQGQVDTVLYSRSRIIPKTRRTSRSNFL